MRVILFRAGRLQLFAVTMLPLLALAGAFVGGLATATRAQPVRAVTVVVDPRQQVDVALNSPDAYTAVIQPPQSFDAATVPYIKTEPGREGVAGQRGRLTYLTSGSGPKARIQSCWQEAGTLSILFPAWLDVEVEGKQVLFQLMGGVGAGNPGTVYCQDNPGSPVTAASLNRVGKIVFEGTAVRLDLLAGGFARISVAEGAVLFVPTSLVGGEVIRIPEGQQLTIDLSGQTPIVQPVAPYDPSAADRSVFADLRAYLIDDPAPRDLPVAADPPAVSFGFQQLNTRSEPRTIRISNPGRTAVSISDIRARGEFTIRSNSCTGTLSAGGSCAVSVVFSPTQPNSRTGSLEVIFAGGADRLVVPLDGAGTIPTPPTVPVYISPTPIPTPWLG